MILRMSRALRALALFASAFFLAAAPALAVSKLPVPKPVEAHPAMWTVHGPKATAYLLGSIHVLPPNVKWHTSAINTALKRADIFVFEIPMDEQKQKADIEAFVKENGLLPQGMALPSLLIGEVRKDYTHVVALTDVQPELLTPMRPWLAALTLQAGLAGKQHLSPASGVDRTIYDSVSKRPGVQFRAFETLDGQLRLLMPQDQALEVQEFDASLKEMLNEKAQIKDLLAAWEHGDVRKLHALMAAGFKGNPKAEKAMITDRNARFATQLKTMLAEDHTFFITVGAAHLVGPKGVPALLRREGYKVDGPNESAAPHAAVKPRMLAKR